MITALLLSLIPADLPSVASIVGLLTKREGLLENYVDPAKGRFLLKLPKPQDSSGLIGEYLYVESLSSGLGSNDVGLDRGEDGETYIVRLRVRGEKLVVEAVNQGFRANTENADERLATERSFPESVLWASPLLGRDPDGTSVADLTDFIVRDAHHSGDTLKYELDGKRSYLRPESCLSFPENLELEAELTFTGKGNRGAAETSPDSRSVSLIQHHSLVKLPEPGFKSRIFDPRSGFFGISYYDFAAGLDQPLIKRFIARFRLEKTDPTQALSPVKKPIVYYLDRGTPEPIRSALLDGIGWWAKAFEEAGFKDAFRIEMLPDGANPLDIRYNVVQWIHRSTRGYSLGGSVVDPRTGEIVKAVVRLDSSRIRQDLKIFEGLVGAGGALKGGQGDMTIPGLARIRQLGAHEVGHSLGLRHNFAGSTYNRASVMDYPAPLIGLQANGKLDFSNAYGVGVGAWDKFAISYGYTQFQEGTDELAALQAKLVNAPLYLTDDDDPPTGGADWRASKFTNGSDPVAGLRQSLAIRRTALEEFGERALRDFTPRSELEDVLGPVYFFHRYDLAAACKAVGGWQYEHTVKTSVKAAPGKPVAAATQRAALEAILDCISPDELDLSADLLARLDPPAPGYGDAREKFKSNTTYVFDSLGAANTAADLAISELLNPQRCVRIVELHSRDAALPGLDEVLNSLIGSVFDYVPVNERRAEIARGIQGVMVDRLLDLIDADVPRSVKSRAMAALQDVKRRISTRITPTANPSSDHAKWMVAEIDKFLNRPLGEAKRVPKPLAPLPGSPIGD